MISNASSAASDCAVPIGVPGFWLPPPFAGEGWGGGKDKARPPPQPSPAKGGREQKRSPRLMVAATESGWKKLEPRQAEAAVYRGRRSTRRPVMPSELTEEMCRL